MDIQAAISATIDHHDLTESQMTSVMRTIMTGEATPAQIAGFLVAQRMKGETVSEIVAAVKVMRELALPVTVNASPLIDIVGTGGDGFKLFNVSTASAFVAAAAGCFVAKHGNRSVSSSSGSADLLEQAGVNIELSAKQVAHCVEQVGIGFMFAQLHHSAMKHAIGPRKELATRTLFNMLGPMTNPAGVKRQLLGVYDKALVRPIADVLKELGSEHVMVVHSADGLDEISLAASTYVAELKNDSVCEYVLTPEDVGIESSSIAGLTVADSGESLAVIRGALQAAKNKSTAAQAAANMIALNAGSAIYIAGNATDIKQGVDIAQDVIASGLALEKMRELAEFSQSVAG